MEPFVVTLERTYRRDDPYGPIVAQDRVDDDLSSELWAQLNHDWQAVRRTQTRYRVLSGIGPADYIVISAGFEIMRMDMREYVTGPNPVIVERERDWRLVAVILGLALLVVLLAVM